MYSTVDKNPTTSSSSPAPHVKHHQLFLSAMLISLSLRALQKPTEKYHAPAAVHIYTVAL